MRNFTSISRYVVALVATSIMLSIPHVASAESDHQFDLGFFIAGQSPAIGQKPFRYLSVAHVQPGLEYRMPGAVAFIDLIIGMFSGTSPIAAGLNGSNIVGESAEDNDSPPYLPLAEAAIRGPLYNGAPIAGVFGISSYIVGPKETNVAHFTLPLELGVGYGTDAGPVSMMVHATFGWDVLPKNDAGPMGTIEARVQQMFHPVIGTYARAEQIFFGFGDAGSYQGTSFEIGMTFASRN